MLLSMLYMAIKVLLATAASSHCLLSFLALVAQPVGYSGYFGETTRSDLLANGLSTNASMTESDEEAALVLTPTGIRTIITPDATEKTLKP